MRLEMVKTGVDERLATDHPAYFWWHVNPYAISIYSIICLHSNSVPPVDLIRDISMFCIEHRFVNVCGKCLNQWVTSVNEIDVKPCTTWNSQVRISLEFLESSSVEIFYFLLTNEFSFFIFCGLLGTRTVREIVGSRDSCYCDSMYFRQAWLYHKVKYSESFSILESWIKTVLRIVQILAVKEGIFISNFGEPFFEPKNSKS